MSTQKNLITLCIATVFTLGLAACGGGGGDAPVTSMMDTTTTTTPPTMIAGKTVPSGTTITLPAGTDAPTVTFSAVMDETITVEDFGTFTCVSADGCSVAVADDVVTTTGDILVVSVEDGVAALIAAALPPEPVELNELQTAQAAAADAATAAMTSAGNAETSATAATEAVANLATVQTGETSRGLATKAGEQAALAHAAYMTAKTASDAAKAATDVTAAVRAQVDAENALADATAAETMAGEYGQMAMDAAGNELMIVDTVKTVGGTSLDATAPASQVTAGVGDDAQTTRTGLLGEGMQPMHAAALSGAVMGMAADLVADTNPYKAPVAGAEARTFPIGKLVDSADDMARLMIVTQYAGSKTVKVYFAGETDEYSGTKAGYLTIQVVADPDDDGVIEVDNVALKSEGMYYLAGTGGPLVVDENAVVAATTKPVEVFSYVDPSVTGVGVKTYVVWEEDRTNATATTTTYTLVDIHVELDVDGVLVDNVATNENVEVTAKIPEATEYKHIHFGVWAALGAAEMDGSQELSDLGIGFVQSIGDGLTGADMPNNGGAKYSGNWVGAVQRADEDGNGDISLVNNAATLDADFDKATITATLTGLATLEGAIDTNTFSGTKATVGAGAGNMYNLDSTGKFMGSFSGGFYGAKAGEAGGVFGFTSEDNEAGAFRGAFGADRKLP